MTLLMLRLADCLTLSLPFIATLISIATAYANSRHKSIELAMKYSSLLIDFDKRESSSPFECFVKEETRRAQIYYTWKGLSRLTDHRRPFFNYALYLVCVFGWMAAGASTFLKTVAESGEVSGAYIVSCVFMFFSTALMAYCRYDSTLYSIYLDLNNSDRYFSSYAAVHQARAEVIDESLVPALASFAACSLAAHLFGQSIVCMAIIGLMLLCNSGFDIQRMRTKN